MKNIIIKLSKEKEIKTMKNCVYYEKNHDNKLTRIAFLSRDTPLESVIDFCDSLTNSIIDCSGIKAIDIETDETIYELYNNE